MKVIPVRSHLIYMFPTIVCGWETLGSSLAPYFPKPLDSLWNFSQFVIATSDLAKFHVAGGPPEIARTASGVVVGALQATQLLKLVPSEQGSLSHGSLCHAKKMGILLGLIGKMMIYHPKIDFTGGLSGFLMIFLDKMVKNWENDDLVGGWALPLWKMMEFVSWDCEIPNLWKNKIHVPNHQPVIYSKKIDFTGGLSGFLMIFPDKMVKHWENEDSPKWGSPIFRQSQVEIFEIGMIMGLFGKFYGDFSGVHYNKSNHMECNNK